MYATYNMSVIMIVEDYIYSMAMITKKEGIIVKNRSDMFAVFVGITKNVLQVRGSTCTKQRK